MKDLRHIVCAIFIALVAVFTFLKIQTDDEIYMDFNSFDIEASGSDTSAGVLSVEADAISDKEGLFAVSRSVDLPKGSYNIEIDHDSTDEISYAFMDGEKVFSAGYLPENEIRTTFSINLPREINDLTIRFYYKGEGTVTIKHLHISSAGKIPIYSDNLLGGLILIAAAIILDILSLKKRGIPLPVLIGVVTIFTASYPLFASGFLEGHDTAFHLMRIEGIKDALLDGQFPAVIYPNAAYGHGYLGTLYPNIFLYIPAVLRLFRVSALNAYRASFLLINIFSYITAYLCGKGISTSRRGAVLAAVLYTLAPFRIIDVYFRSTLGEAIAMVFFPLVLLGIYNITIGDSSKWRVLFVGMCGLIESHILSALFGGVLCAAFVLVFIVKLFKEKRIMGLLYAAAASVAGSLMFFVPFFYYRAQNLQLDATIRRFNPARAAQPMYEIFSTIPRLLTDKDDAFLRREMIPTLGLIGIACIALTLCCALYGRIGQEEKKFVITALALELAIVYIASDLFPWNTLEKFEGLFYQLMLLEHPWRLFSIAVCIFAPISALALERTEWFSPNFIAVSLSLVILTLITDSLQIDMIFNHRSRAFDMQTGNTAYSYNVDYMPDQFRDMEALRTDDAPVAVAYGKGGNDVKDEVMRAGEREERKVNIKSYYKNGTHITLEYEDAAPDIALRLPLLYYRGYRALDAKGQSLPVYEGELGDVCVGLKSDSGNGAVKVDFKQPVGNMIAFIVSVLSIIVVLWNKPAWILLKLCGKIKAKKE